MPISSTPRVYGLAPKTIIVGIIIVGLGVTGVLALKGRFTLQQSELQRKKTSPQVEEKQSPGSPRSAFEGLSGSPKSEVSPARGPLTFKEAFEIAIKTGKKWDAQATLVMAAASSEWSDEHLKSESCSFTFDGKSSCWVFDFITASSSAKVWVSPGKVDTGEGKEFEPVECEVPNCVEAAKESPDSLTAYIDSPEVFSKSYQRAKEKGLSCATPKSIITFYSKGFYLGASRASDFFKMPEGSGNTLSVSLDCKVGPSFLDYYDAVGGALLEM